MVGRRRGAGEDGPDDAPEEIPDDDLVGPAGVGVRGEAGGQERRSRGRVVRGVLEGQFDDLSVGRIDGRHERRSQVGGARRYRGIVQPDGVAGAAPNGRSCGRVEGEKGPVGRGGRDDADVGARAAHV